MSGAELIWPFISKLIQRGLSGLWVAFLIIGAVGLLLPDAAIGHLSPLLSLEMSRAILVVFVVLGFIGAVAASGPLAKRRFKRLTQYTIDRWTLYQLGKDGRIMLGYFINDGIRRGYMSPEFEAYQRIADRGLIFESAAGDGWRYFDITIHGWEFIRRWRSRLRRESAANPELAETFRRGTNSAAHNAALHF